MHVKLFWKNDRPIYRDVMPPFSFRNLWNHWKLWWFNREEWRKSVPRLDSHDDLVLRNLKDLEREINAWLSQNPKIQVIDIKQSASGGSWSPSNWMISIWYESCEARGVERECREFDGMS